MLPQFIAKDGYDMTTTLILAATAFAIVALVTTAASRAWQGWRRARLIASSGRVSWRRRLSPMPGA